MLIVIDPGKIKCGVAIFDDQGVLQKQQLVHRLFLPVYLSRFKITKLVIGESPVGKRIAAEIEAAGIKGEKVFVAEENSTFEARRRYWLANPPRGLWRLVPTSFRFPPKPVDDFAAVILGERYLHR